MTGVQTCALPIFKEDLQRCADAFISGDGKQYIAFSDVKQSYLRLIERQRRRSEVPALRFLYDPAQEVLIIKLKQGPHHEEAKAEFGYMFNRKLCSMGFDNTLQSFGSTTYIAPNGRSTEADDSWGPSDGVLGIDLPSLVIEVGVSESLGQLRMDAHHWLTQGGGQNRVIIILAVNKPSRLMTIERWELEPTTRPTRASIASGIPTKMQEHTLHDNGTVNGGPLLIPATKVYDQLPLGLGPDDFTFTAQELAQFFRRYWQGLP